jgi:phage shock protein PspC (stress-responsive transcriptional regulator)/heme/copper-type cytochrome/quinol oxidase subunit 2
MKKVININFQGRVIPIEETAYDILKQYVESLRRYFANEEGRDEIINDIEDRIAELFTEALKKGGTCITEDDVNAIIASIGRPEDFGDTEEQPNSTGGAGSANYEQAHTSHTEYGHNRFYRDENHKVIAGVCSGIANYFGIDPLVVRILFVIFAFGFGFGFITYLVLWVAVPSTASTVIGSSKKRLFRDPENKLIAGVCGGLSNYFGVNVWIPRILFLIPFISIVFRWSHWGALDFPDFLKLSFSPGATLLYIILWLVLPEAQTTSEKLEMKGERVDLNTIKNTIQKDMEGFSDRAQQFGKEVGERAKHFGQTAGERSKKFSEEVTEVAKRNSRGFGDVIALIFKIFAYFILAVVLFALVMALFGIGIATTGFLPLKEFLITDGWENIFVWGAFILFIWVPVIGIITWIIRRIAKIKGNSQVMRFSFLGLWLTGVFCIVALIASLHNDFRYHNNPVEENVVLQNPKVKKLEVKSIGNRKFWLGNDNNFEFEPFRDFYDEDTVFVKNVRLRIIKADNDSFRVTTFKMASGNTRQAAATLADRITYDITQKDTMLLLGKGVPVTRTDKFRNQTIYITIAVPVGKLILINNRVAWSDDVHIGFGWNFDYWEWRNGDDNHYNWDADIEYVMTENGLKRLTPEQKDNDDNTNQDVPQPPKVDSVKKDTNEYHYKRSAATQPEVIKKTAVYNDSENNHHSNLLVVKRFTI